MSAVPRVIHFVTGGGSGATKVALDLACGHLRSGNYEPLLVLRRKAVPLPKPMQEQIAAAGLRTAWVDRWPKFRTVAQLAALCAEFRPQVFAAHGNSEHFWGRLAAFRAGVPVVVHIEQNRERYSFWRIWRGRSLAARTTATVCVSPSIAERVRLLGLASPRLEVIPNGVDTSRFSRCVPPLAERSRDIVMVARFARQKDQPTLIRAARRLADGGWDGRLLLGGGGKASHRQACEKLVRRLGLQERVEFLGQVSDAASLYHRCRAAVLATHHEGLPLVLIDYLAAGCAVIASDIPGVTDVLRHGENGWLFPDGDDARLADLLGRALQGTTDIQAVATRGQHDVAERFTLQRMIGQYEGLFRELLPAAAV
jgi:glycosyltransferase involved in cell wall biosynthesis